MTEPSDLELEPPPEGAPELRRRGRWRWLLLVPLVVVAGVVAMAITLDPAPLLMRQATQALGRPVTVAAARIHWSLAPSVEIEDIHVANISGGSVPDMFTAARALLRIELPPLLHGELRLREVELDQPDLVLERDTGRVGNWKFGAAGGGSARDRPVPSIGTLTVQSGRLSYRGSSGSVQHLTIDTATLRDSASDAPVNLDAVGSFNDVKLHMVATGDSFAALRSGAPFAVDLTTTAESGTLAFKGTIDRLLDFEGISGKLTLDFKNLNDLAAMLGASGVDLDLPLALAATLTEASDFWRLSDLSGSIAGSATTGTLSLAEGKPGEPDDIAADLDFTDLDLAPFARAAKAGTPDADAPVKVDAKPPFTLALRLSAELARLDTAKLAKLDLDANLVPGKASIAGLSFVAFGGKLTLSGTVEAADTLTRAQLAGVASGIDINQLAGAAGLPVGQISGKLDTQLLLDMTGATAQAALRTGRGTAVLSVLQGSISRELVELASTDLRTVIRRGQGSTRLSCLLGVIDLRNGIASLTPFRLRTPDGTISGGGQYDLARDSVDGFVRSESATTGFFALDVPMQISGSIRHVSVAPARRTTVRATEAQGAATVAQLPPGLKALVNAQPCSR
jgi:uncharacterized protein involved in outer membrane biogenesis